MTPLALLFMCLALAGVTGLVAWCYYRVLLPPKKREQE